MALSLKPVVTSPRPRTRRRASRRCCTALARIPARQSCRPCRYLPPRRVSRLVTAWASAELAVDTSSELGKDDPPVAERGVERAVGLIPCQREDVIVREGARVFPATTKFPSGWTTKTATRSESPLKSVVTTPPSPNEASSVPSASYRARAKSIAVNRRWNLHTRPRRACRPVTAREPRHPLLHQSIRLRRHRS